MDAELKELLTRLCDRLDAFDARLKVVEATAHKQVTDQDLMERFRKFQKPEKPRHGFGIGVPLCGHLQTYC